MVLIQKKNHQSFGQKMQNVGIWYISVMWKA